MKEKGSSALRRLLQDHELVVAPGVYDVMSALIVETAGFKAVYMTGSGTSMFTLREFIQMGVAAVHIEDQVSPGGCRSGTRASRYSRHTSGCRTCGIGKDVVREIARVLAGTLVATCDGYRRLSGSCCQIAQEGKRLLAASAWKGVDCMSSNTALLLIDVQKGMFNKKIPAYGGTEVLANINALIEKAHAAGAPVFVIQHAGESIFVEGTEEWELHPGMHFSAGDQVIAKHKPDSFLGTPLQDHLKSKGITHVVTAGFVTHGCVKATSLGAVSRGWFPSFVGAAQTRPPHGRRPGPAPKKTASGSSAGSLNSRLLGSIPERAVTGSFR